MPRIVAMKFTPAAMVPTPLTIRPSAQKSVAGPRANVRSVKRRVGEPADGRRAAGGEAE